MEITANLSDVIVPVFLCAAVGLVWAKLKYPFNNEIVTSLVFNVGAPALILATFAKVEILPAALTELAGAAIAAYAAFGVFGLAVLKFARLAPSAYLPSLMFPLTGSMGLPVCLFAFGPDGLALALVYFVIGIIGIFTIGMTIAAGKFSRVTLLRTPVICAVILAVILEMTETKLPQWAFNTADLLGDIVIPTQLIALGVALAGLRVSSMGRSIALAMLRLGMGVLVGLAVAEIFGLSGVGRAVVILQSAMPVAISNYLFAQLHNREPEEVAGMVLVSTTISFVTLPLLLMLVL